MLKTSSLGVRYALYSLASSKPEPGGTMPKVCAAFLSQPGARDIKLYPTGDVRIKRDNNNNIKVILERSYIIILSTLYKI